MGLEDIPPSLLGASSCNELTILRKLCNLQVIDEPLGPKVPKESENEFQGPFGRGARKVKNNRKKVKIIKHLSMLTLF